MHAPIAIAPQRRLSFRPNFIHLFRLALTRSRCHQLPKANRFLARLALLVGGRPRDAPLPPSNCAKIALAGATSSPNPPQDFFSRIPSDGRGFRLPYRQIVASPHFLFVCVLGHLFFRSSLYQLVLIDEISLPPPGCPKRTIFWSIWTFWQAQGPSPAQQMRKIRCGGGVPPLARAPAPLCGALAGGCAQPVAQKKSSAFGRR
jgi:hypothetical protein